MTQAGARSGGKKTAAPPARKAPAPAARTPRENPLRFFRDVWGELRRVTWPTPDQTRRLTIIVIVISLIIGAFLGIIDFIFSGVIRALLGF